VTFRIRRLAGTHRITFALSGELNRDQLAELGTTIERENTGGIVLDLDDVTLVTREGVAFIRRVVADGAELVNCPQYLQRWIAEGEDEA
jgi:ABC-type transporter Mla MlaB component